MKDTYNVTFVMDYACIMTTVTMDSEKFANGYEDDDIIDEANHHLWENYQFSPLMHQRQDIEIEEAV